MASTEVTLEDALRIARHHWQSGNLVVAERAYRDVLNSIPDNLDALHELGLVCYFRGKHQEAYAHLSRVVELAPEAALYRNNFAIMAQATGRRDEAEAAWREAIRLDPGYADAHSSLAVELIDRGQVDEAIALCRKALEIDPDHADAALNLGHALQAAGRLEAAVPAWEDLAARRPDYPKVQANLGNAYRRLGRIEDAEQACRRAVELDPAFALAHNNLGNALTDQGKIADAEACYRRAVDCDSRYAEAHDNLGLVLQAQGRHEDAARAHRFALAINPDFAQAHGHLSTALRELGDIARAESAAHQAIALAPDTAEHHLALAELLMAADRADEAEAVLNEALALEPESSRVYLRLASALLRADRFDEAEESARRAAELQPDAPWPDHMLSQIHFMAGRMESAEAAALACIEKAPRFAQGHGWVAEMYQTLGRMDEAMTHAREALRLNPEYVGGYYTIASAKSFTADDPDLTEMEALAGRVTATNQKIPLCFALGRAYESLKDYDRSFRYYKQANDLRRGLLVHGREAAGQQFARVKARFDAAQLAELAGTGEPSDVPVFIVGMPRSGTTLVEQILSSHPQVFGAGELATLGRIAARARELTPETCAALGQEYVESVRRLAPDAARITDKMPGNFIHVGLIAAILPNARIIHCRRDPVDTCLSCYKQNFARGQHWSYELAELGEHFRRYRDLMAYWHEVLPGWVLGVDYEAVVADTENQARRLVDHIGLPWNDACLEFYRSERPVMTASKAQVRQPIYTTSVEKWRRYGAHLEPLLAALGDAVPGEAVPGGPE